MKRRWLVLLAAVLWSGQALASAGITISPPIQQITIDAAKPQTEFSVSLTNHTSAPQTLNVSSVDFGALEDTGGLYFIGQPNDFEKKYGLANWLSLPAGQINLAPGQTQTVNLTVANRSDLSPGGHYGALLFKPQLTSANAGSGIDFNQVLTGLIFARKTGGERFDMQLSGFDHTGGRSLPQKLNLRFYNAGNVHVVPRGIVSIVDPLGHQVSRGIINEDSSIILPGNHRNFTTLLASQKAAVVPGRYKLLIDYRFDGLSEFTRAEYDFNFVDATSLTGAGIGLLLIVGGGVWLGRRFSRRRRRK